MTSSTASRSQQRIAIVFALAFGPSIASCATQPSMNDAGADTGPMLGPSRFLTSDGPPVGTIARRTLAAAVWQYAAIGSDGRLYYWGDWPVPPEPCGGPVRDIDWFDVGVSSVVELVGPTILIPTGCARLRDSSVWCWGTNDGGSLGNPSITCSNTAVRANLP